jgi:hypothetical protein
MTLHKSSLNDINRMVIRGKMFRMTLKHEVLSRMTLIRVITNRKMLTQNRMTLITTLPWRMTNDALQNAFIKMTLSIMTLSKKG